MTHRDKTPALAVSALGVTQIIGYGTLYYSYSILAADAAAELGWPQEWIFGVLSAGLLLSAFLAPVAGEWADRFGAGRLMTLGSLAAALSLTWTALVPGPAAFGTGVIAMQLASCFVLYATAFVAIVQMGSARAQRDITHLTLIAGFASTVFWPLTTALEPHFTWREIMLIFAAMHLFVCLPLHAWLRKLTRPTVAARGAASSMEGAPVAPVRRWTPTFVLLLVGFAIEGFVLSAILVQMVPLTAAVGLGAAGVFVASLFGPAQVASRLINMLFGKDLPQTWLAVGATACLASGLAVLLITAPSMSGAVVFAILFGLGSGLMSIVGGTLPLELFGRAGYGGYVGWITAARQFTTAFAPFGLTVMISAWTVFPALGINLAIGVVGVAVFATVAMLHHRRRRQTLLHAEPAPATEAA